ncbi:hypothetical protein ACJX0J_015866, partial [Zea mays]
LELTLATRTVVDPFHLPIQFPPYPKHLMPFHEVLQQPHKRFIDVIGIVIHLAPLEHIVGRSYREAILMDSRWDIIVVGIWPELLQRNALRWDHLFTPPLGAITRTPCTDISNTINTCDQNGSNSLRPIVDAKERKRQRDKDRYATMCDEQKNEKNKKRREARLRNKELNKKRPEARQRNNSQNMMPR